MKLIVLGFLGVANALTLTVSRVGTIRMAAIGDSGVSFQNVAREWRCKCAPLSHARFAD